jgi:putative transposase
MEGRKEPELWTGSHNKNRLLFHLQLTPKYRMDILSGCLERFIISALRYAAYRHEIIIYSIKADIDHIHILFQKNPILSEAEVAQYLKGISSYLARLNFPCLKLYCDFAFWSSGYYIETIGNHWAIMQNYINNQGIAK